MTTNKKERAVIEAALACAYCPSSGGYADGMAMEDTWERLVIAVANLTGIHPDDLEKKFVARGNTTEQGIWWPTVEEVNACLPQKPDYKIKDENAL